jgi:hypothetical protein
VDIESNSYSQSPTAYNLTYLHSQDLPHNLQKASWSCAVYCKENCMFGSLENKERHSYKCATTFRQESFSSCRVKSHFNLVCVDSDLANPYLSMWSWSSIEWTQSDWLKKKFVQVSRSFWQIYLCSKLVYLINIYND